MNSPAEEQPRLPRHLHNRFIAAELLRIRERSGLTGDQVGQKMDWSPSKVSRIERGKSPFDGEELRRLLPVIKATKAETKTILDVAADPDPEPGSYKGATAVLEWATTALPGAVQCPAYAWAVETAQNEIARREPKAAEAAVDAGMRWQALALRETFRIEAIFDESALQRPYGGQAAMSNQLAYMLALAERKNVSIRMIPMNAPRLPIVSSFVYVQFPGEHTLSPADTVLLREPAGETALVLSRETYHYHYAWEHLERAALPEDQTVRAIEESYQWWKTVSAA